MFDGRAFTDISQLQIVYQANVTKSAMLMLTCVKERMKIALGPKGEVEDGYLQEGIAKAWKIEHLFMLVGCYNAKPGPLPRFTHICI